jgi:antitoxin component YwqK of YwqJK toxin-antitoxin module
MLETRRNHDAQGRLLAEWHVRRNEEGEVVQHGRLLRYHPSGRVALRGWYRNGYPVGIWRWYDEEGALLREVYQEGSYELVLKGQELDNPNTVYRTPRGAKLAEGLRKFERAHGLWRYYYPNGMLKAEGRFVNGIPDGRWTFQHPNGLLSRIEEYELGIPHGRIMRGYPNGQEQLEGGMSQGLREGPWRTWYEDGQPESEGPYRADRREGVWRFWQGDGTLTAMTRYANGEAVEQLPLPETKRAARPPIIDRPEALPFRPRIYDESGAEIRLSDP